MDDSALSRRRHGFPLAGLPARRRSSRGSSAARTERFVEEVRGDDPEIAAKLRNEERKLEAGGLN
jgi:hypothetical protein